jgi:adenylosuccinate lyase
MNGESQKYLLPLIQGYGKDMTWLEEVMGAKPLAEEIEQLKHPYPDVWRYWSSIQFMSEITSGVSVGVKRFCVIRDLFLALQAEMEKYQGSERKVIGDLPKDLLLAIQKTEFTGEDVWRAKKYFEKVTDHDTAAAGDYEKVLLAGMYPELAPYLDAVYFGATSEDIMSVVFGMIANELIYGQYIPRLLYFCSWLPAHSKTWLSGKMFLPLLLPSFTHEQIAEATSWPIKMATRMNAILLPVKRLRHDGLGEFLPFSGKFGGAIGNNTSLFAAYRDIDWWDFSKRFVKGHGLKYEVLTDQCSTYVNDAENFKSVANTMTQLIKFAKDFVRLTRAPGQFFVKQRKVGRKGSSIMPNKSNPWESEGAISMLKESRALIGYFAEELQDYPDEGNMQRSYLFRCLGKYMSGAFMGLDRIQSDMAKFHPNVLAINEAFNLYPGMAGSALQTKLKQLGFSGDAYRAIESCALRADGSCANHEEFVAGLEAVLCEYKIASELRDQLMKIMNFQWLTKPANDKVGEELGQLAEFIGRSHEQLKRQFGKMNFL